MDLIRGLVLRASNNPQTSHLLKPCAVLISAYLPERVQTPQPAEPEVVVLRLRKVWGLLVSRRWGDGVRRSCDVSQDVSGEEHGEGAPEAVPGDEQLSGRVVGQDLD